MQTFSNASSSEMLITAVFPNERVPNRIGNFVRLGVGREHVQLLAGPANANLPICEVGQPYRTPGPVPIVSVGRSTCHSGQPRCPKRVFYTPFYTDSGFGGKS